MERRGSAGASLSFVHRHHQRLRALSASGEASGPRARMEGSSGHGSGSGSWLFSARAQGNKAYAPSGHFGGESACGHWVADCGHGCLNRSMRDPVWKEHPNHGSSRVRPINRSAVAQVSLGAWEAPCKADFAAARKKVILFFHLSEFRSLSGRILAYGIIEEGTPALRARSFMSCSSSLAVFTLFCFSASCCLYWASSLSHEPALRKRLPASA